MFFFFFFFATAKTVNSEKYLNRPTTKTQHRSQASIAYIGFVVEKKVVLGQVFFGVLKLSPVSVIPPTLYTHVPFNNYQRYTIFSDSQPG
jgi:hypothetical protein